MLRESKPFRGSCDRKKREQLLVLSPMHGFRNIDEAFFDSMQFEDVNL